MKKLLISMCCTLFFFVGTAQNEKESKAAAKTSKVDVSKMQSFPGYFNFWWEEDQGKIWLEIDKFDQEFIYVNSLPAGIGSNDLGLDRGQLGDDRIVKFIKVGPKVLMIQPNYSYRAISDNEDERRAVEEAFAQSVIWGFKVEKKTAKGVLVDATSFLLRDAHDVTGRLQQRNQGSYKVDQSRSAVHLPKSKNFPKNTELDAMITFTGDPKGQLVRSVTPSADAITVRQHHSFVELPASGYQSRKMDPRSGYFGISYYDYATPISEPLVKRFINRHRLEKKDPSAAVSEAVEPIVYYVDRGAPEPIRSALVEGARWWNQAFEAAGYKNAFQVKVMPEGADPMDVRYNVIQWVHRSTRGWSYGSSVVDPRTGEIIKGHVTLGSLRVRQDFLIAQGLIQPYETGKPASPKMQEMALARLRQLSAHEVGHTLGISHNFAASVNDRASVMDYPHPYVVLNANGQVDFSKAYDDKIGPWDKRVILYGYQDFPKGTNEEKALQEIIRETLDMGLSYISDQDARPAGGAHPYGHLWDNGAEPVGEMKRLLELRQNALNNFGEANIPPNTPLATLEEVLVPLYLAHRYQVEAVAKVIGGLAYSYAMRGDGQKIAEMVPASQQKAAIDALIQTLDPKVLVLPERLLNLIPPKPIGYRRSRESFKIRTGLTFDPLAVAESSANHSLLFLLHPHRAARLVEQKARDNNMPGLHGMIQQLVDRSWKTNKNEGMEAEIGRTVDKLVLQHLMQLSANTEASGQARAVALLKINQLEEWLENELKNTASENQLAHYTFALSEIVRFKRSPDEMLSGMPVALPDGSPIGMEGGCGEVLGRMN